MAWHKQNQAISYEYILEVCCQSSVHRLQRPGGAVQNFKSCIWIRSCSQRFNWRVIDFTGNKSPVAGQSYFSWNSRMSWGTHVCHLSPFNTVLSTRRRAGWVVAPPTLDGGRVEADGRVGAGPGYKGKIKGENAYIPNLNHKGSAMCRVQDEWTNQM